MNEFWESRFSNVDYAYGIEPNAFFKDIILNTEKGKILFPAEGEGRNAAFAARLGFDVYAFDYSPEGKKKAVALAKIQGVNITYEINSYEHVIYPEESFDVIVLIFAHMAPFKRREWHRKLAGFLKPGGTLILEGFSKEQIQYNTGGPPNIEMLFSEEELKGDFSDLQNLFLEKTTVNLDEGTYHQGKAAVIRGVFRK